MSCLAKGLKGVRILVVEPEERLADILKRGLLTVGASVDVAHTHEDGIQQVRQRSWDYCVVAHAVPHIQAGSFLDEAHALQTMKYIVTSQGDISLLTTVPPACLKGLLLKPFHLEQLINAIKRD